MSLNYPENSWMFSKKKCQHLETLNWRYDPIMTNMTPQEPKTTRYLCDAQYNLNQQDPSWPLFSALFTQNYFTKYFQLKSLWECVGVLGHWQPPCSCSKGLRRPSGWRPARRGWTKGHATRILLTLSFVNNNHIFYVLLYVHFLFWDACYQVPDKLSHHGVEE